MNEENLEIKQEIEPEDEGHKLGRREAIKLGAATAGGLALGAVYLRANVTSASAQVVIPTTGEGDGDGQPSIELTKVVTGISGGVMYGSVTITNVSGDADVLVDVIYWQDEIYEKDDQGGFPDNPSAIYLSGSALQRPLVPIDQNHPPKSVNPAPDGAYLTENASAMIPGFVALDDLPKGVPMTFDFAIDLAGAGVTATSKEVFRNEIYVWIFARDRVFHNFATWNVP